MKTQVYPWNQWLSLGGGQGHQQQNLGCCAGLSIWILNLLVDMAVVGKRKEKQLLKSSVKKRNGQSIIDDFRKKQWV